MPGIFDYSKPAARFLTDWFLYRSALAVDEVQPELVTSVLDLSASWNGLSQQIRVIPVRTAGAGTVTLTLFYKQTGSLADVATYWQMHEQVDVSSLQEVIWDSLVAYEYRILVSDITAGAKWDLHVAHTR